MLLEGDWRAPDPALLTVRRIVAVLWVGLPGLALALVVGTVRSPAEGVVALVAAALLLALLLRTIRRQVRAWGYAEREDDLVLRRGVVLRRTTVVPYGRMQYVDVTAGPLDRRYGIASVTLHTAAAATDATIPGLAEPEAARLRDRLAALGEARAAGV